MWQGAERGAVRGVNVARFHVGFYVCGVYMEHYMDFRIEIDKRKRAAR